MSSIKLRWIFVPPTKTFGSQTQFYLTQENCNHNLASLFVNRYGGPQKVFSIIYTKERRYEVLIGQRTLREYFESVELGLYITSGRIMEEVNKDYDISYSQALADYYEWEKDNDNL